MTKFKHKIWQLINRNYCTDVLHNRQILGIIQNSHKQNCFSISNYYLNLKVSEKGYQVTVNDAKQKSTSLDMLISIVIAIVAIKEEKKETIMLVLHDIE